MPQRRLSVLLAALLILVLCAGCSSSNEAPRPSASPVFNDSYGDTQPQASLAPELGETANENAVAREADGRSLPNMGAVTTNRKQIFIGNMEIETKDFPSSLNRIGDLIDRIGGYVDKSDITGLRTRPDGVREMRRASYTIKIPVEQFGNFLAQGDSIGNVLSQSIDSQDVTDQYFDTEARLSTLRVMEERFLAMLEQATELSKVIELERTLSDLRYQIENLTGTLRKWDSLVAYSTLHITLQEVGEETPVVDPPAEKTFGQSLCETFDKSVQALVSIGKGLVFAIVAILPVLLPFGLILGGILFLMRRRSDRKRKAGSIPPPPTPPAVPEEKKDEEDT